MEKSEDAQETTAQATSELLDYFYSRAAAVVCERIHDAFRDLPAVLQPFRDEVCRQVRSFDADLGDLQRALRSLDAPPARDLKRYVLAFRHVAVQLALYLADGRIATSALAARLGHDRYTSYRDACRALTDSAPKLADRSAEPEPHFNLLGLHRLLHRTLPCAHARVLARRLRELRPDAFADGLPDAQAWVPRPGPAKRRRIPSVDAAAERPRRQLRELCVLLEPSQRALLEEAGERFLESNLYCNTLTSDGSASTEARFLIGNTLGDLLDKMRLEVVLARLLDPGRQVDVIAAEIGLNAKRLRQLLAPLQVNTRTLRRTLRVTRGDPVAEAWLDAGEASERLAAGKDAGAAFTDDDARLLASALRDLHPDAFEDEPERSPDGAPFFEPTWQIADLPYRLAAVVREQESWPRPEAEIDVDWPKMSSLAEALDARPDPDAFEGGLAVERLCLNGPDLYRIREIQCAVLVEEALEKLYDGVSDAVPPPEPWSKWLRVKARPRPENDVERRVWESVVSRLGSAQDAVERWSLADARRVELLSMPREMRRGAIREPGSLYRSYLLARVCLIAGEHYQRGRGLHVLIEEEAEIARLIAEVLVEDHLGEPPWPRSAVVDLLALAHARTASPLRADRGMDCALAAIRRAEDVGKKGELGDYVAAEVAYFHASLLKDDSTDMSEATQFANEAVRRFAAFDGHMAACVKAVLADIRYLTGDGDCVATVCEALNELDSARDPRVLEVAGQNLLEYLIDAGCQKQFERWRDDLPRPKSLVVKAHRRAFDGRAELAWGSLDRAETLLEDSRQQFVELGLAPSAAVVLLFLAAVAAKRSDLDLTRERLEAAETVFRAGQFKVASPLRVLIHEMNEVEDLAERILTLATEAEGRRRPAS